MIKAIPPGRRKWVFKFIELFGLLEFIEFVGLLEFIRFLESSFLLTRGVIGAIDRIRRTVRIP